MRVVRNERGWFEYDTATLAITNERMATQRMCLPTGRLVDWVWPSEQDYGWWVGIVGEWICVERTFIWRLLFGREFSRTAYRVVGIYDGCWCEDGGFWKSLQAIRVYKWNNDSDSINLLRGRSICKDPSTEEMCVRFVFKWRPTHPSDVWQTFPVHPPAIPLTSPSAVSTKIPT